MLRVIRLVGTLSTLLALVVSAAAQQPPKKRIAVLDFDYGTVQTYVAQYWGGNQDVGKGIADLLVQKLVNDGKYRLIERKQLDKILAEQNFSNSDRADPSTAAKIGRALGVDAIILGSITKFGRDDKSTTAGGGGLGLGKFGLGGVQKRDAKAVCAITERMVDTSTAEILAAVTGNGESKRGGLSLVGAGGGGGGAGAGAFDTSSKNFGETILGEAILQAVNATGDQLDAKAGSMPTRKAEASGQVADVSGNTLILNIGRSSGLQPGDALEISRPVRTVKDPNTGKVIKTITNKIGDATVTECDASSCTVTFNGSSPAKVGDTAKTPSSN